MEEGTSSPRSEAARAVYLSLEQVQEHGNAAVEPLPAFQLYKVAREEELLAYRSICRVFGMHYGCQDSLPQSTPGNENIITSDQSNGTTANKSAMSRLPKAAQRILEDLRESWCIPNDRATAEFCLAVDDEIVQGVHRSGVLRRREDFFDGVEDVDIEALVSHNAVQIQDDGGMVYSLAGSKRKRQSPAYDARGAPSAYPASHGVPVPSNGSSAGGRKGASRKSNVTTALDRIGREVKEAAYTYLYSQDEVTQEEARRILEERKSMLLLIQDQLNEQDAGITDF